MRKTKPLTDHGRQKPLILVGGGGHCKACIDVAEACGAWEIRGILDLPERVGESVLGYPILGTDSLIPQYAKEGVWFLVAVGQIRTAEIRRRAYERIKAEKGRLATIVSPMAYVSSSAILGEGVVVMHRALVNAHAVVGNNVIINTMALVEHDAVVADNCHIATGAVVNGGARLGAGCFVGSNAVLVENAVVPECGFVAAGSMYRQREA